MPDPNTPNILFIHTDSMDGRLMGCMGHPAMAKIFSGWDDLSPEAIRSWEDHDERQIEAWLGQ